MNSRQLWKSYQRYKFSRAETSWDILKIRDSEMAFPGVSTTDTKLFHQNTHKTCTGNNDV